MQIRKNMAKIIKFVYVMTTFLLFLVATVSGKQFFHPFEITLFTL